MFSIFDVNSTIFAFLIICNERQISKHYGSRTTEIIIVGNSTICQLRGSTGAHYNIYHSLLVVLCYMSTLFCEYCGLPADYKY